MTKPLKLSNKMRVIPLNPDTVNALQQQVQDKVNTKWRKVRDIQSWWADGILTATEAMHKITDTIEQDV